MDHRHRRATGRRPPFPCTRTNPPVRRGQLPLPAGLTCHPRRHRPDGGRFTFPADSLALFDLYDQLFAATAGALDPLVGRQLEHPLDPQLVTGVAELRGQALCAVCTTKRAWGNGLHHILDATTGKPVHTALATWTVADTAALADGLATALFVTDPPQLTRLFPFSYLRMRADGRADISHDFPGEIFQHERQT